LLMRIPAMHDIPERFKSDSAKGGGLALRDHYDELVRATLAGLWRRKLLILAVVAGALFLGVLTSLLLPSRYTADAFMRVGFSSENANGSGGGAMVSVDASLLVETRSRLFKSHQLARRVVDQLGLERLASEAREGTFSSFIQNLFVRGSMHGYREDLVAAKLLRNLTVRTEARAYLITVSYTARDPELAAFIANAFVAESLKITRLQKLDEQRAIAEAALFELIGTLGERHPNVARARAKLAGAETLLAAEKRDRSRQVESTTSESVIAAEAIAVPSSPNPPLIIGMALVLGLVAGVGIAVLVDRGSLHFLTISTPTEWRRAAINNGSIPACNSAVEGDRANLSPNGVLGTNRPDIPASRPAMRRAERRP
jgi:uncharacterized protein involved in exopolysaccharide biosynthesis